jgi:hypothetical protein
MLSAPLNQSTDLGNGTEVLAHFFKVMSSSSNCGMRNCWNMSRYTIPVMVVSMKKKKGPYAVTCIKLAVFCYIMTGQNVVYVLCINVYTLSML